MGDEYAPEMNLSGNVRKAFQIDARDNVATALQEIAPGEIVRLIGETREDFITSKEKIPEGHKIALLDMEQDTLIIKYGVVIGKTEKPVSQGSWVHLHVMRSLYDERSGHLDVVTGAPKDTVYK